MSSTQINQIGEGGGNVPVPDDVQLGQSYSWQVPQDGSTVSFQGYWGPSRALFVRNLSSDQNLIIQLDTQYTFTVAPGNHEGYNIPFVRVRAHFAAATATAALVTLYSDLQSDTSSIHSLNVTNTVSISGNVSIVGNVSIGNTVAVSGSVSIVGSVTIGNTVAVSGSVSIVGNVTIGNTVAVSGSVSIVGNVSIGNTVTITGSVSITGNVNVGNTVAVSGSVSIVGSVTIGNTVTVTGTITVGSITNTVTINGNVQDIIVENNTTSLLGLLPTQSTSLATNASTNAFTLTRASPAMYLMVQSVTIAGLLNWGVLYGGVTYYLLHSEYIPVAASLNDLPYRWEEQVPNGAQVFVQFTGIGTFLIGY